MIKHSISTLVLLCAMAVPCTAADYKGTAPKDGATYHLYNVGTGKFLSSADGTLTLGGTNLTVRLNKTADGYYTLTTADGKISATLWDAPRSNGSGEYTKSGYKAMPFTLSDDFHRYAIEWSAGQVSIVGWPLLWGRGAISLTSTVGLPFPPTTNSSTPSTPTYSSAFAIFAATARASAASSSDIAAGTRENFRM